MVIGNVAELQGKRSTDQIDDLHNLAGGKNRDSDHENVSSSYLEEVASAMTSACSSPRM